jgi:hypothetical protein
MVLFLALALLLAGQQNRGPTDSATNMQQRAHEEYERHRQAPGGIQDLFRAAARYGHWMGSPEENAAIGVGLK